MHLLQLLMAKQNLQKKRSANNYCFIFSNGRVPTDAAIFIFHHPAIGKYVY